MSTGDIIGLIGIAVALLGVLMTAIGGAFAILVVVVGMAIAWGTIRAAVNHNYRAHCDLAGELRPAVAQLTAKVQHGETQHGMLEERTRGIKEAVDRIEGYVRAFAPSSGSKDHGPLSR